jgi:hypothetical protein
MPIQILYWVPSNLFFAAVVVVHLYQYKPHKNRPQSRYRTHLQMSLQERSPRYFALEQELIVNSSNRFVFWFLAIEVEYFEVYPSYSHWEALMRILQDCCQDLLNPMWMSLWEVILILVDSSRCLFEWYVPSQAEAAILFAKDRAQDLLQSHKLDWLTQNAILCEGLKVEVGMRNKIDFSLDNVTESFCKI